MRNYPRNQFNEIEIIYPERTMEQKRDKLYKLNCPPSKDPRIWKKYIKNATNEEIENTYNWLCVVGRINN